MGIRGRKKSQKWQENMRLKSQMMCAGLKNSTKDRHVSFLEPVNITLHDKRCDKNKALEMKSLRWGALTTIPCILIKRGRSTFWD